MSVVKRIIIVIGLIVMACVGKAQLRPSVMVEFNGQAGGGAYSPFWLTANRQGLGSIETMNGYARAAVWQEHPTEKRRFSYSYGLDLVAAYNNTSKLIVQQAYADVRYRSVFLTVGSKERPSTYKDPLLTTGDYTWSGNARPIPQVRAGFHDWVIPFRKAPWFALKGEVFWGWFVENDYFRDIFNTRSGSAMSDILIHNKEIYFKFLEDKSPWQLEAGFVLAEQFGGTKTTYRNGEVTKVVHQPSKFVDYLKSFIPFYSDEIYFEGNYLGNWNLSGSYKLNENQQFKLILENIFEDASSMGRANRMDGSYTLEYHDRRKRIVSGAAIEYFNSRDQSGTVNLYWVEGVGVQTNIKDYPNGNDQYFNHGLYNSWSHRGMTIGNPLILSPIYNEPGNLTMKNNRVEAFHLGVNGWITSELQHRLLLTYMRGWGTTFAPFFDVKTNFAAMLELIYSPKQISGFSFRLSGALDHGDLLSNNSAVNLGVRWTMGLGRR